MTDGNQEAAKAVNEAILDLADRLQVKDEALTYDFVCECGCLTLVEMTPIDYRNHRGAFAPGHPTTDAG